MESRWTVLLSPKSWVEGVSDHLMNISVCLTLCCLLAYAVFPNP